MKAKRMIVGLAVGTVCAVGLAAWRVQAVEPPRPPQASLPAPVPVVAAPVQVSHFPLVLTGIGTVMPYNVVDIHAQVTGTIERIGFVEGRSVHPGSLIAQLDPRPYQAALAQAQANLARDTANLGNARANLARYVPLLRRGFASGQQVADQAATVSEDEAAVAADRAAISNAATQLSYTTITSPIDGVTGIRRVDVGNIVQPAATTPIVTITQIQPIAVVFTLPQKDVPAVQKAMAKTKLTAIAYGEDGRSKLGTGALLLMDNTISQSSGTVQLKAIFPNRTRALWPGEFVNVRLVVGGRRHGISVPLDAVQQGQQGPFVFAVRADGTVQQRTVTVAETLDGRALVSRGLQAGDRVVTAGQYRLSNGIRIAEVSPGNPQVQNSTEAAAGML